MRGGVAQVLDIYDKYIFKDFRFIANSGGGGFRNLRILLVSICRLIKQLLSKREIKIVHIHTASYNSFYRSAIFVSLSKLLGRKVILHIHGGGFKDFYKTNPRIMPSPCSGWPTACSRTRSSGWPPTRRPTPRTLCALASCRA